MKRESAIFLFSILLFPLMMLFAGCTHDGDGPLDVMPGGEAVEGNGFFLGAVLDSGKSVHLISDTLYITLSKIWSFSNCSLTSIDLDESYEESQLVISPQVNIKVNTDDCPAPMYRSDTTFKMVLPEDVPSDLTDIVVKNDTDSLITSIKLRRGKIVTDTFYIFVDSAFAKMDSLPLRTKDSPSVLRVLDSITPQKFYWRTLRANCTRRVDKCSDVVADTLFPDNWRLDDTVLVPVHYACASADSMYCLKDKWEYDTTALGKVNVRLDTVWHTNLYYIEKIPKCAWVETFRYSGFVFGEKMTFWRSMFVPDDNEISCGPSTKIDWFVYNLSSNFLVLENDDEEDESKFVDSLFGIWKSATVARDTVVIDTVVQDSVARDTVKADSLHDDKKVSK
ncbi:hypothetical protein [Fibrobacter sp.]|uniref:hypothetical protein n=1 Tax=Fibrobacter sp. TaxID=35828 RepID=UPI0025C12BAF|nr:hypothetical protein [Fibrobacter sp.]MBR3070474.1 hypothetical protein [Fibrobacter sp.]